MIVTKSDQDKMVSALYFLCNFLIADRNGLKDHGGELTVEIIKETHAKHLRAAELSEGISQRYRKFHSQVEEVLMTVTKALTGEPR